MFQLLTSRLAPHCLAVRANVVVYWMIAQHPVMLNQKDSLPQPITTPATKAGMTIVVMSRIASVIVMHELHSIFYRIT